MNEDLIDCPESVMEDVIAHVNGSTAGEVGGVLVGTLESDGAQIVAALPAHKATSGSANVTFTHEVWEEVLPIIDRDFAGSQIVGWYHSHPGFGVFLSEYDLFIHRNFFSDARMVALVVDPLKGEGGWFAWDADEIRPVSQISTPRVTSDAAIAQRREVDQQRRTSNLVVTAAAAFLVALIAGLVIGRSLGSSSAADSKARSNEITRLRLENQGLRTQINGVVPTTIPQVFSACTADEIVRPGDGFLRIAERRLGDESQAKRLQDLNNATEDTVLEPGQRIRVPAENCRPETQ